MSIVTIILLVRFAANLLEHGATLVGMTRPDRTDFPQ